MSKKLFQCGFEETNNNPLVVPADKLSEVCRAMHNMMNSGMPPEVIVKRVAEHFQVAEKNSQENAVQEVQESFCNFVEKFLNAQNVSAPSHDLRYDVQNKEFANNESGNIPPRISRSNQNMDYVNIYEKEPEKLYDVNNYPGNPVKKTDSRSSDSGIEDLTEAFHKLLTIRATASGRNSAKTSRPQSREPPEKRMSMDKFYDPALDKTGESATGQKTRSQEQFFLVRTASQDELRAILKQTQQSFTSTNSSNYPPILSTANPLRSMEIDSTRSSPLTTESFNTLQSPVANNGITPESLREFISENESMTDILKQPQTCIPNTSETFNIFKDEIKQLTPTKESFSPATSLGSVLSEIKAENLKNNATSGETITIRTSEPPKQLIVEDTISFPKLEEQITVIDRTKEFPVENVAKNVFENKQIKVESQKTKEKPLASHSESSDTVKKRPSINPHNKPQKDVHVTTRNSIPANNKKPSTRVGIKNAATRRRPSTPSGNELNYTGKIIFAVSIVGFVAVGGYLIFKNRHTISLPFIQFE